jgi:uncharacterized protein YdiU (UPF0061 family)
MPRTRLSAVLYLILVLASGILVGVVSHRLYVTTAVSASLVPAAPRTLDEFHKQYFADMRKKVGVNDDQIAAVKRIFAQTKQKFDDLNAQQKMLKDKIQQDQHDAISALLTPQQKVAFDIWRAERARLHAEQQKKQQQQQK